MDFRTIAVEDGPLFREYAGKSSFLGTEVSFTDMYSWGANFGCEIAFSDGFLFLRGVPKGDESKAFYFYPLGSGDQKQALDLVLALAEKTQKKVLCAVDDQRRDVLESYFPGRFSFEEQRGSFDYIYLSSSLASLSGKALHSKKNHLNKFLKRYPEHTVEPVSSENFSDCLAVNQMWCRKRREADPAAPHCENDGEFCAVKRTLAHYDELGCRGILLRIEGKPVAFTIGTPVRDNLFVTHFEKALTEYQGAFAAVNYFFAQELTRYQYINREEDMGIEGLRKAKLSYCPAILYRKYHAKILS